MLIADVNTSTIAYTKVASVLVIVFTVISVRLHEETATDVFYSIFVSVFPLCGLKGELVTASKAIIEKEYQPRVIISKQGPNPFTKLTDQELDEYRREVELKQKGSEGKGRE